MTTDKDKKSVKRNAERRKRYAEDPEFRARVIKSTRNTYRATNSLVDPTTCRDNLPRLKGFGMQRSFREYVVHGGAVSYGHARVTFTIKELAAALNRRSEVVYRWIRKDMFPGPQYPTGESSSPVHVYSLTQAKALVEVMGRHQLATPYYRRDHVDTRDELFKNMMAVS